MKTFGQEQYMIIFGMVMELSAVAQLCTGRFVYISLMDTLSCCEELFLTRWQIVIYIIDSHVINGAFY